MKDGIHPKYQEVVIKDISSDFQMITRSTKGAKDKVTIEGVEYPQIVVEVSSASHPYYTGKQILVDSAGRIDRFKSRFTEVVGAKRKTRDAATVQANVASKPMSKTKQKAIAKANAPVVAAPAAVEVPAAVEAPAETEAAAAE